MSSLLNLKITGFSIKPAAFKPKKEGENESFEVRPKLIEQLEKRLITAQKRL